MITELILSGAFLYILYKVLTPNKPNNFPPGPDGYPIVGGAFQVRNLNPNPAVALEKLGKTYGPVSGFRFGKRWCVVVNGYEAVKNLLDQDDFAHRPDLFTLKQLWNNKRMGIFFGHGDAWKEQRRFALRNLREFGFGKTSMEEAIHEEVTDCIQFTKSQLKKSAVISLQNTFAIPMLNMLWAITIGVRVNREDANMMSLLEKIEELFKSIPTLDFAINEYPFLRHAPIISNKFNIFYEAVKNIHATFNAVMDQHVREYDEDNFKDFMDVYLKEIQSEKKKGIPNTSYTKEQCAAVIVDFSNAGARSVSNTVAFAILHMLLHPEIQEKVHAELDTCVGKDRLPSLNDRASLHYTEAVLTEAQRMSSIAPLSPPRCNYEGDAKFNGYDIPKNTLIMVNIHSVHMEKSYWGDPEKFRPERFLDAEGKFVKPERILSFGHGKRVCPGEVMAKMSYYAFFTGFMQNFKLEIVPGKPKPTLDPILGFTVSPKPFEAIVTSRI